MKKIITKDKVLGFIIGGVLFSGLTAFAYNYNAKQVSYSPNNNNWKVSSVKDALDDLKTNMKDLSTVTTVSASNLKKGEKAYTNQGKLITGNYVPSFGTTTSNYSLGRLQANRSTSLALNKGKYLVYTIYSYTSGLTSVTNESVDTFDDMTNLSSTGDISITNLSKKRYMATGNNLTVFNQFYSAVISYFYVYDVVVNDNSATITLTSIRSSDNQNNGEHVILYATPIE